MKLLLPSLMALALAACGPVAQKPAQPLTLVPAPQSVTRDAGTLELGKKVALDVDGAAPGAERAVRALLSRLRIDTAADAPVTIRLRRVEAPELGPEGYRLDVGKSVVLSAHTDTGLFHAVQTLRQMLPAQPAPAYTLPHAAIVDQPAYTWRGSSVDVARSYLPVSYLKKHIDRMAFFKLNRLHLHLTDDQGWRIQIRKYPALTDIGGASAVEGGVAGYYTQEELKDLVAYAQARHVVIVPEIDLPGHTQAAIASLNELACDDVTNLAPYTGVEVGFSKLCLTKPEVIYPFVRNVLEEVVAIFPSEYIHIGGDEIKDPGYAEFISRASAIVDDLGRTAVVWEEGSVADMRPEVLLQLWNDEYDIQAAVDKGHKLILSPCSRMYLDHSNYAGQPDTYTWCRKEGVPLKRVYAFAPEAFPHAAGVEGTLFSELVHSGETADNRLWPRLAAVAELAWTHKEKRGYLDFTRRMGGLRAHLDALGIHYYADPDLGWGEQPAAE